MDRIGITYSELSEEDKKMLDLGIAYGIDDNVFFGLAQKVAQKSPPEDNYCFIRAKAFTDAVFTAAYTTASVGSAVEAVKALDTAGLSGAMALATSETGVGGAAFGTAAVTELAEAAVMAGRSQGIFKKSSDKLKSITSGTGKYIPPSGEWKPLNKVFDKYLNDMGYSKRWIRMEAGDHNFTESRYLELMEQLL